MILIANMFNLVAPTMYRPGDDSNGNSSIIDGGSNKTWPIVYNHYKKTVFFLMSKRKHGVLMLT